MFELNPLGTERTVAATNLLIALVGLFAAGCFYRLRIRDPWKATVWMVASLCLLAANLFAAAYHGLSLPGSVERSLWAVTELSLVLLVACFAVAAARDLWSERVSRIIAPAMAFVGILFFSITLTDPSFWLYVVYEALFVGFALIGYGFLAFSRRMTGAFLAGMGLLVTLIAAVVQQTGVEVTMIWTFDHNGLFHLIQLLGVILLVRGILVSLEVQRSGARRD
ncbi:MAG: hypothetical protein AAF637_08310 [Pseudomonadota bacterium]